MVIIIPQKLRSVQGSVTTIPCLTNPSDTPSFGQSRLSRPSLTLRLTRRAIQLNATFWVIFGRCSNRFHRSGGLSPTAAPHNDRTVSTYLLPLERVAFQPLRRKNTNTLRSHVGYRHSIYGTNAVNDSVLRKFKTMLE